MERELRDVRGDVCSRYWSDDGRIEMIRDRYNLSFRRQNDGVIKKKKNGKKFNKFLISVQRLGIEMGGERSRPR